MLFNIFNWVLYSDSRLYIERKLSLKTKQDFWTAWECLAAALEIILIISLAP